LSHTEQVSIDGVFLPTFHFSSLFRCTSLKDAEFSLLMNRLITSSQTSSAIYVPLRERPPTNRVGPEWLFWQLEKLEVA
jgi:hypothetical protein